MSENSPRSNGTRQSAGTSGAAKSPATKKVAEGTSEGSGRNREELASEIEQTRQELGETVEELTAKADVSSRARDKAAQLRDQAAGTLDTLTETVRQKAPQVREQVAAPVAKATQAIPEPVRRTTVRTTRQTAQTVSRRPGILYAAAGACAAAGLWLWRRGRRS